MSSKILRRTTYINPKTGEARLGDTARLESQVDMEQYYQPLEQIAGSGLHEWGIASGLGVTATLGKPNVQVLPGIALDATGRHISLAAGAKATLLPPSDSTLVDVDANIGVTLPTAGQHGEQYVTIQWRETFDNEKFNRNVFEMMHTPWLRLVSVDNFIDNGNELALAHVILDGAGNVLMLSQSGRRGVSLPVEAVHLRRTLQTGNGQPETPWRVESGVAAEIRARSDSGLAINTPSTAADGALTWQPRLVVDGDSGQVGIGTEEPHHRLSIRGGPPWTSAHWGGAIELENAAAIAWQANTAGQRAGVGHTNGGLHFFRTSSDPGTTNTAANYDLKISDSGDVNIQHNAHVTGDAAISGNASISGKLGIGTTAQDAALSIDCSNVSGVSIDQVPGIFRPREGYSLRVREIDQSTIPVGVHTHFHIAKDGGVGIGTDHPRHRLSIRGGPRWTRANWIGSIDLENAAAIAWQANTAGQRFGIGQTNGGFHFFRTNSDPGTTNAPVKYDLKISDTGIVSVNQLDTRGADIAEHFDVQDAKDLHRDLSLTNIQPGFVVSIDPEHPGTLIVSNHAYDRCVAGIISGAGGVKPGVLLSQMGEAAHGEHPIALTGRVYCWADASNAPIEPGDLLTTSSTPGHAMKVTDDTKAHGAIIGKAMTRLKAGQDLVLVLVALQ